MMNKLEITHKVNPDGSFSVTVTDLTYYYSSTKTGKVLGQVISLAKKDIKAQRKADINFKRRTK